MKQTLVIVPLVLTLAANLACGPDGHPGQRSYYEIPPTFEGTGMQFLSAVVWKDEETAMPLLTASAQAAVAQHCTDGKVVACFDNAGFRDEKDLIGPFFLPEFSQGSNAVYGVGWEPEPAIWVVLEIVDENGAWRIDGWRGLIPSRGSEGIIPYDLFDGTDTTNQFPPED
jgi:hypothetical protein